QLVEAFKAMLEELEYADLLLHVIDVSNPEWEQQVRVVEDLIVELGAQQLPRIDVYNKADLVSREILPRGENVVCLSAKTGAGVEDLIRKLDEKLDKGTRRVTIHLPYDKAGMLDTLYREAKVESVEYAETVDIVAVCTPRVLGQVHDFVEGWVPPKEEWED
ncbi:MAG: GTPase HflX, partial [Oscillospiraceae bacterium]|nr:GTPase HflX [Oscillospiraceae bacterium]